MTQQTRAVAKTNLPKDLVGTFTESQLQVIKEQIAPGVTDANLLLFLYTAKRSGLDPLTKQIYCVTRGGKMTIQTGIDGYRAIAAKSGQLAGEDDVVFDSEEGQHPEKATVTVYRMVGGTRCPFTATARWSEYAVQFNGQPAQMWAKMPYLMLGKCAAALAYRKAFPNDLSGLYTAEEMQQADSPTKEVRAAQPGQVVAQAEEVQVEEVPTISADEPTAPVQAATPAPADDLFCHFDKGDGEACFASITLAEKNYSVRMFKQPLCRAHQAAAKGARAHAAA